MVTGFERLVADHGSLSKEGVGEYAEIEKLVSRKERSDWRAPAFQFRRAGGARRRFRQELVSRQAVFFRVPLIDLMTMRLGSSGA